MASDIRSGRDTTDYQNSGKFQQFGMMLALAFYILSVFMVNYTKFGITTFDPSAKVITIAHWQLEDGFREGIQDAIASYTRMKAEQGESVHIIQNAVPLLTYPQWHLTQLISGNPADIVEISGDSNTKNRYYTALSAYIGDPNPYNKGTPLEGIPWRDTFVDDMNGTMDMTYADYYGVTLFAFTSRMYVNLDLLKEVTGSEQLPRDFAEWLDICRKVVRYGKDKGRPLIPIGAAGTDRRTLVQMYAYYMQQANCDLNDKVKDINGNPICVNEFAEASVNQYSLLTAMDRGELDLERFTMPFDLITELGQFFAPGFNAIDLQTTKFLFASGNVCFFAEGSWAAFSMINNSPFRVAVTNIPPMVAYDNDGNPVTDPPHPMTKFFIGTNAESIGTGGNQFGIPKRAKHFDLSLDFLRYLTSYDINQKVVTEYTKWLSPLKEVNYQAKPDPYGKQIAMLKNTVAELDKMTGLHTGEQNMRDELKKNAEALIASHEKQQATSERDAEIMSRLQPQPGAGYSGLSDPILIASYHRVATGDLENMILMRQRGIITTDPGLRLYMGLWDKDRSLQHLVRDQQEAIYNQRRTLWNNESLRTFFEVGRLANIRQKSALDAQNRELSGQLAKIELKQNGTDAAANAAVPTAADPKRQQELDKLLAAQTALNQELNRNAFTANRLNIQLLMSAENTVGHLAGMTGAIRFKKFYDKKFAGEPTHAVYRGKKVVMDKEIK